MAGRWKGVKKSWGMGPSVWKNNTGNMAILILTDECAAAVIISPFLKSKTEMKSLILTY